MNKSKLKGASNIYSLSTLASILKIPGGADAIERLLLAAGFLTGAYRSSNAHLPYQRYLDRGYFLVIDREVPSKWKALTFCVTSKGLAPVIKKLRTLGVRMPDVVNY